MIDLSCARICSYCLDQRLRLYVKLTWVQRQAVCTGHQCKTATRRRRSGRSCCTITIRVSSPLRATLAHYIRRLMLTTMRRCRKKIKAGEYRPASNDQELNPMDPISRIWERPSDRHLHIFVSLPSEMGECFIVRLCPSSGFLTNPSFLQQREVHGENDQPSPK